MSKISIKENSIIAKLAAYKLKHKQVAVVLGHTIHLHGTTANDFTNNKGWLLHELKHVEQYEHYGILRFLWLYLWHSIRHGYHGNPLEKEAREAENSHHLLSKYSIK